MTAEDIEAAEAAATVAMSARGALQTRLASARATEEARAAELSTLLGDREPSRVSADLAQARERLQQAEDAASALPALTGRLTRLRSERDTLGRTVDQQRQAIATAVSRAEAARAQAARAAQTLAHGLGEHAALCPCSGGVAATSAGSASRRMLPAQPSWATTARSWRPTVRRPARCAPSPTRRPRWPPRAGRPPRRRPGSTRRWARRGSPTRRPRAQPCSRPPSSTRMSAQLRSLDTQRDQAEALLAQPDVAAAEQQPAPDLDALAGAAVAAREAATQSRRAQALAESADRRIHELRDEVLAIVARIGPAEAEQAVVQELADCVGGTSGQQHPADAAVVLSSWRRGWRRSRALANERLQVMTEGRYQPGLHRRAGRGAAPAAAWACGSSTPGPARAARPRTLSGGESFMASLALALGLAMPCAPRPAGSTCRPCSSTRASARSTTRASSRSWACSTACARAAAASASSATSASCASASPPSCG